MVHLKKKAIILIIIIIICVIPIFPIFYFMMQNNRKLTAFEVLEYLPYSIEVFVYHDVNTLKNYFDSQTILNMFLLSDQISVNNLDGVILTNEGTYIILKGVVYKNGVIIKKQTPSMYDKIGNNVTNFFGDISKIDSLGYADNESTTINSSSYLSVTINNGTGLALAVFSVLPSTKNYDLLEIVGVYYHNYSKIENNYYLNFTNNILIHVGSGTLMNFSHTQMCIEFFINGAEISSESEISLREVVRARAEHVGFVGVQYLLNNIENRTLSLSPIIAKNVSMGTFDNFGNLAPYGIVLKALQQNELNSSKIRQWLIDHQKYGLWGYHSGPVNTSIITPGTNDTVEVDAIDSTLVFEGLFNQSSIALLDMYRQSSGGFLAQLNNTGGPYSMNSSDQIWFWCQEDYGVSASAYYFLDNISLSNSSTLVYLKTNFDNRSSMWIANPYYIEYLTARALKNQSGTELYLQNITQKILSEKNADGTWGYFDKELSTALAVLTLKELNYTGIELDRGLLNLIKMQQISGYWNGSDIFFSALDRGSINAGKSILINGTYFDYILYEDIDPIITTSFCILALLNNHQYYSVLADNPSLGGKFSTIPSYIEYVLRIYIK